MARYIDATQLQAKILDASIKNKLSESREVLKIFDKMVQDMPTADVVPREEAENWYQLYHSIKEELKQEKMYHRETEKLCDRYCIESQHAKQEVAREIFEEIEKIAMHGVTPLGLCLMSMGEAAFAELKKKYTEGE